MSSRVSLWRRYSLRMRPATVGSAFSRARRLSVVSITRQAYLSRRFPGHRIAPPFPPRGAGRVNKREGERANPPHGVGRAGWGYAIGLNVLVVAQQVGA